MKKATYKPIYADCFLKCLIEGQRREEQDSLDYGMIQYSRVIG
jgi:hypothetical protein